MAAPNPDDNPAPAPVHDITQTRREDRLRDEFALVRVKAPVYIEDKKEAQKRKGSAERMAKMRERQAEKGLKTVPVPSVIADEVKAKGGWDEWLKSKTAPAPVAPEPPKPSAPEPSPVPSEVIQQIQAAGGWDKWLKATQAAASTPTTPAPKPASVPDKIPPRRQLNPQEKEAIEIGFRVLKCTGPKRWLLKMLLGS